MHVCACFLCVRVSCTFLPAPLIKLGVHACKSYRRVFVVRFHKYLVKLVRSRVRAMASCCLPRCVSCYDVVRYCPKCEAAFSVCGAHRYVHLQCPWPTLSGVPCLAIVPADQHWDDPLTQGPMYLCPRAHMGKPPGLHEHVSKARRVGEPPNTGVRGGMGTSY